MLKSWHNFFFVSFDPGGLVSVDKPPLALWLEATSAKVFGYSGWAILLPEALAGVAAVWLLYLLVARYFGRIAGLAAALALAVSPVSVSVNRDNNPDALLALLLVAAAYVGARAIESGRLRTLLAERRARRARLQHEDARGDDRRAGARARLRRSSRRVPWRRAARCTWRVAGAVLVAVSGAWIAAVDLTPAADRPYVGSTSDNSALSLALDYNGLGRVTGQTGGTSTGGGLGGAFSGTPGVFRLLQRRARRPGRLAARRSRSSAGCRRSGCALRRRRRRELAALVVVGGWFAAAAVVFSFSSGIIHTYYLSALAPATSALVGVGLVALWRDARRAPAAARDPAARARPLGVARGRAPAPLRLSAVAPGARGRRLRRRRASRSWRGQASAAAGQRSSPGRDGARRSSRLLAAPGGLVGDDAEAGRERRVPRRRPELRLRTRHDRGGGSAASAARGPAAAPAAARRGRPGAGPGSSGLGAGRAAPARRRTGFGGGSAAAAPAAARPRSPPRSRTRRRTTRARAGR